MNPMKLRNWNRRAIGALALGVLLSGAPLLAAPQDQQQPPAQTDPSAAPAQQDQQAQPAPPQQQDPQMQQQSQPDPQSGPQDQPPPPPASPQTNAPAQRPMVPEALTLPAGTVIQIRTNDWISSDRSQKGDQFTATLVQPIIADGFVVMRRGQTVIGQVTDAQKAGRVKGVSKLQLDLSQLTLV
ncbi:MAG: hypothetical protein WCA33_01010, partial [Candidatus Acidiferrales bacterium]